jgi:hypothetical protein
MKLFPQRPPAPAPANTSKIGSMSLDRTKAQSAVPSDMPGASEDKIKIYTYFTKAPPAGPATDILYTGDRMWAKLTLTLETAGPVAVGDAAEITPVLSGKGQLLETGVPLTFDVAKGNRVFIAATSVNRVKVEISPYPWLETITGLAGSLLGAVRGTMTGGKPMGQPVVPGSKL